MHTHFTCVQYFRHIFLFSCCVTLGVFLQIIDFILFFAGFALSNLCCNFIFHLWIFPVAIVLHFGLIFSYTIFFSNSKLLVFLTTRFIYLNTVPCSVSFQFVHHRRSLCITQLRHLQVVEELDLFVMGPFQDHTCNTGIQVAKAQDTSQHQPQRLKCTLAH